MKITADWLAEPGVQAILRLLTGAGHQAYVVGGCVRNAILGVPVADIDIATDARPDRVIALAAGAGIKAVPTGIDHGTVTLVTGGVPHEVTTFRRDIETFGRHAVVAFSDRIEEDAARRDFTMNALYADAEGRVLDPLGGLPDLRARRVRFVGRAEERIAEDHLRSLRFFRFHAQHGDPEGGLDPEALAAIAAQVAGLDVLSRERIGQEMRKLLAAPDPAPALAAMQATGVLGHVLPGADPRAIAPLVHLENGLPPRALRRLAALGGESPAEALRLSRAEERGLALRLDALRTDPTLAETAYRHGAEVAEDVALVRAASLPAPLPDHWRDTIARAAAARLPVVAADLMPALSGAALGARLKDLEARWIASGFALTRDDLLS